MAVESDLVAAGAGGAHDRPVSTADRHGLAADHLDLADVSRRLRAIFVGSIGNLVEWYDFYAYAAFALYFAASFFPGNDPVVQQLNAAILFAIGFIVRPIGGWLFGHLGDHYGRRNALMLSVLLMCFGSLMIAVMPTYATIGVAAPVLLAGVKTAAVINVGTATVAAFIGAGGFGERIVAGLAVNDSGTMLAGALPAAVLALLVQWAFDVAERRMLRR